MLLDNLLTSVVHCIGKLSLRIVFEDECPTDFGE
jgi:hypothetical protein